jgi:hypothetical protein
MDSGTIVSIEQREPDTNNDIVNLLRYMLALSYDEPIEDIYPSRDDIINSAATCGTIASPAQWMTPTLSGYP